MSKRGNNEGSITRHKASGKWMARYTVQTAEGSKRKTLYGKTRDEVREKLTKAMADRDSGFSYDTGNATVGEYLARWLSSAVASNVKPVTYESYARLIRCHIEPALGRRKLSKLKPGDLQGFYHDKLSSGLSPTTVRYLHAIMHRALYQAVRWEYIDRNPAASVDPPKPAKDEIRPLDREQANALLEAARGDKYEALYIVALTTGVRIGELLALRWADVDLEAGTVRVQRTLSAAKSGPRFTSPKSGKGRSIALTRRASEALKRHRATQNADRLKRGEDWTDHNLLFPTSTGNPMRPSSLTRRHFKPLLEQAGLSRSVRFHDLRHTCATLLLAAGHNPKLVQDLLGHASVAMTLDRYSHVMPGMSEQTAAAMEAALG